MKKSVILKQQRAAKVTAQGQLIEARNATANGTFTDEQQTQFRTLEQEITDLDAQIENEEAIEAAQARTAAQAADTAPAIPGGQEQGEKKEKRLASQRYNIGKAIREAATGNLTGLEKEMHDEQVRNNKAAMLDRSGNLQVPEFALRADGLTVSQDSGEYGAELVSDNTPRVQETLYPKTILEELGATFLRGLSGGSVPLPRSGDYSFQWLAEDGTVTPSKEKITGPKLEAKRAAVQVPVYNRLIAQSSVDVLAMIQRNLLVGENVAIDRVAINGDGVLEPLGVLNNTDVNLAAASSAAAPTWADMVELQTLVEAAESTGMNMAFVFGPALAGALKTITKDAGSGRFLLDQNMIDGIRTRITTLVPELAGNKVAIYGNWSDVYVGKWGSGLDLSVDGSSSTAAAKAAHIVTVNSHVGVALANPKAFAVNKFLTA